MEGCGEQKTPETAAPTITVLLPVRNGAQYLQKAIESIVAQSFTNWEMLVLNEWGSDDGSAEIARECARRDGRIRLLQNERTLGLAQTLNRGMELAEGAFIARMDADDISLPQRFEKQLARFHADPELGICGGWQRHVQGKKKWLHRPPADAQTLRAAMLFTCELCHSTVMLRRETVERLGLYYDPAYCAEDYELWTRAAVVTKMENIPEVLGEYHVGGTITREKMQQLEAEHGKICLAALRRALDMDTPDRWAPLLNAWHNIFRAQTDAEAREKMLGEFKQILLCTEQANREKNFVSEQTMLRVLRDRWLWAAWDMRLEGRKGPETPEELFLRPPAPALQRFAGRVRRYVAVK